MIPVPIRGVLHMNADEELMGRSLPRTAHLFLQERKLCYSFVI